MLEGNEEVVANFNNVMQRLIQIDPKAMVLLWNDDSDINPQKRRKASDIQVHDGVLR